MMREIDALLAQLPRFADQGIWKPGLERTQKLLDELGRPQDAFDIVHVAGTNGKGSTASFLAAMSCAAGLRTGLHTSPHLWQVTERMRIDGEAAPENWLAAALRRTQPLVEKTQPSYFELTFALSLLYFAEHGADLVVVETGMGGRLDATNVLAPVLSIITDIGLDHTRFLGHTIERIAQEKAGIVKPGIPVVTSARSPAVEAIEEIAETRGAPAHRVERDIQVLSKTIALRESTVTVSTPNRTFRDLRVGLAGKHQIRNAMTALRGAELLHIGKRAMHRGMREVCTLSGLHGRWEVLVERPLVVTDAAHNADALAAILHHLESFRQTGSALTVLFGVMRDKDTGAMGKLLAEAGAYVRPVKPPSDRMCIPEELAGVLRNAGVRVGAPCTVREGIRAFLAEASTEDTLLTTGSHRIAVRPEDLPQ